MRHICTFLFFAINAPQVKHICLTWGLLNFLESNGSCPRCRQYSVVHWFVGLSDMQPPFQFLSAVILIACRCRHPLHATLIIIRFYHPVVPATILTSCYPVTPGTILTPDPPAIPALLSACYPFLPGAAFFSVFLVLFLAPDPPPSSSVRLAAV